MDVLSFRSSPQSHQRSGVGSLISKRGALFQPWEQVKSFSTTRELRPLVSRKGISKLERRHLQVLKCYTKEIPRVEAESMDEIYDILAERLVPFAEAASKSNSKYMVGICGPPGAGKSTVASEVTARVNKLWLSNSSGFNSREIAVWLPMDGFHLYRHQLDKMEDPEEAHARRGAPWTFDPEGLLRCLQDLRTKGSGYAPSFDHGVGDPKEDDIFIAVHHKIIIVEGNYLLLDDEVWRDISSTFNEKWFIDLDLDKSMQRVLKRHIATGKPPDAAKWRIGYNDRPNAELIMKSKTNADLIIKSIDRH